jgi:S1-C subfamily serine protease
MFSNPDDSRTAATPGRIFPQRILAVPRTVRKWAPAKDQGSGVIIRKDGYILTNRRGWRGTN